MSSQIPEVQALFAVMGVNSVTIATIGFCVSVLALVLLWIQRRKLLKAMADVKFELSEMGKIVKKWHGDNRQSSRERNVVIDALVAEFGYDPQNTADMAVSHIVVYRSGGFVTPIALPSVLTTAKGVGPENTLKARLDAVCLEIVRAGESDAESGTDPE